MDEFGKDALLALLGVMAAKTLDELVEFLKRKKTSKKPGKHSKRS